MALTPEELAKVQAADVRRREEAKRGGLDVESPRHFGGALASMVSDIEQMRALAQQRDEAPALKVPRAPGMGDVEFYVAQAGQRSMAQAKVAASWTGCGRPECVKGTIRIEDAQGRTSSPNCDLCGGIAERTKLFNRAGLPAQATGWDLTDVADGGSFDWSRMGDTTANGFALRSFLRTWLKGYEPGAPGLVLYAGTGRGKTHIAAGLVRHLTLFRGVKCRYVYWPQFLRDVRTCWDRKGNEDDLLRPIGEANVVVLDELRDAKGKNADWAIERIETVAQLVVDEHKTCIITTNLDPHTTKPNEGLVAAIGSRAHSRLIGPATVVDVLSSDYRMRSKTNPPLRLVEPGGDD